MANIVKVIQTEIDRLSQRVVKVFRYGKSDVQTALEAGPYGIDSNPIKDMAAIFAETTEKGKTVIVGYVNKNQLADIGEVRLYSTDANGGQQFYIWLKNTGICEIGGTGDFMVRYTQLETAFNELQNKFNTFANSYTPGSPSTLGTPPTISPSTADITKAKITEIKTLPYTP
jgi:hypothetical protein